MIDLADDGPWLLLGGSAVLGLAVLAVAGVAASRPGRIDELRADRQYPPPTRLLLDVARGGVCGQSMEERRRWAETAQAIGEWNPDRAVAEPALELSQVLREALDEEWSRHLCAHAVGAAWRAEHPFRRAVHGDPYDVLLPHVGDAEAVRALDRARALPRVPATLAARGGEVAAYEKFMVGRPSVPYSRTLALALLGAAEAEVRDAIRDGVGARADRAVVGDMRPQEALRDAEERIRAARAWVEGGRPVHRFDVDVPFKFGMPRHGHPGRAHRAADERLRRVSELAQRAVYYVRSYIDILPALQQAEREVHAADERLTQARRIVTELRARGLGVKSAQVRQAVLRVQGVEHEVEDRAREVSRFRAMFPDFYPEEA